MRLTDRVFTAWSGLLLIAGSLIFAWGGRRHPPTGTSLGPLNSDEFFRNFARHIAGHPDWIRIHDAILAGPLLWVLGASGACWLLAWAISALRSTQLLVLRLGLVAWLLLGIGIAALGAAVIAGRLGGRAVATGVGSFGVALGLWPVVGYAIAVFDPGVFTSPWWLPIAGTTSLWFGVLGGVLVAVAAGRTAAVTREAAFARAPVVADGGPNALRGARTAASLVGVLAALIVGPAAHELRAQIAPTTASLQVRVIGLADPTGDVKLAIYDSPETHARQPARTLAAPIHDGAAEATFTGLVPGDYSVVAFHDRNANGELDRRLFGRPREPYGFSNNARRRAGPPPFEQARLAVGRDTIATEIQVRD